jgi:hypothetical protein
MLITIRRLHRILVDRIADTRWLRDRAGASASWAHYERHARAWRTAHRHAGAARGLHTGRHRAARRVER